MFRIETPPLAHREAERFKAAFYRFIEIHPPPMEEAAWLEVSHVDGGERHAALLWSQDAVDAFQAYTAHTPVRRQRQERSAGSTL